MALTPTAYHIPAEKLAVGDVLLSRSNKADKVIARFTDDETTAVIRCESGEWHYFPFDKEVRISA